MTRPPSARPSAAKIRSLVAAVGLVVAGVGLSAGVPAVDAAAAGTAATAGEATATFLRVGAVTLHRCAPAWCGSIRVPLDYSLAAGPTIAIVFRWYPATDSTAPVHGTVVPVEGGPGYPSIGSVAPDGYAAMYGPLLRHWNMLAVDLRGTGGSAPVDCPPLQDFDGVQSGSTATPGFDQVVAACAAALNRRWHTAAGQPIHASDLFTSAQAAHDLERVVAALHLGPVDLYGDSYGSWFAQVFASRYPDLVRSVTLDSTYAVQRLDPWYRSSLDAMPADFDAACGRSPACAAAESEPAWTRISALAAHLRAAPISGTVPGPDGTPTTQTMGVLGLVDLVSDAGEDPAIYADLDAAARALLEDADPAPLLRLYAQRMAVDEAYFGLPARLYSGGLYFAVSCLDYPQLFDMASSPAARRDELGVRERHEAPATFAPFTTAEWLAMDQYSEAFTGCLDWPAPTIAEPPVGPRGLRLPARIDVLILGGEFDTWTPPAGVPQVQRQIGGTSRVVIMANSTHVVAEGESSGCAVSVLRAFVTDPSRLDSLDTGCATQVAPIRSVGVYPPSLAGTPPLRPDPPGTGRVLDLEAAAAAVDTAGDAVARLHAIDGRRDLGLHGGSARQVGGTVELVGDTLVPGFPVSGRVEIGGGQWRGHLVAAMPDGGHLRVTVSWPAAGAGAVATVTGRHGAMPVDGTMPAP